MQPSAKYLAIIEKAFAVLKPETLSEDWSWDYPDYGGNLTPSQIQSLTPEQVDAIQWGASRYLALRQAAGKPITKEGFIKSVSEQYALITPPQFSALDKKILKNNFYIEWFKDYHEIKERVQRHQQESKNNVRAAGRELSCDEFGLEYKGRKGMLMYPGVFWVRGHRPTDAQIKSELIKQAPEFGFELQPKKPKPRTVKFV